MDFAGVFICLSLRTPYPPPRTLHNVYMYTVYFVTQGKGGGGGFVTINVPVVYMGRDVWIWMGE
jgi:hypothetical protein